jgi:hypothetical protein
MKRGLPLLLLLLLPGAHAQTRSMADDIRAGRAALEAGQPQQARALFGAALAHPDGNRDDAFAAAMGLGRASLWLGDHAAAARAFDIARTRAADAAGREAADSGRAAVLNAQDYPRKAFALLAPFARGQATPTQQLMQAMQALGWQDKSPPYLEAMAGQPAATPGARYRLLQEDMRYALAPRVEGGFDFSHDSEKLDTWRADAAWHSAPRAAGRQTLAWGVAIGTVRVDDPQRQRRLDDAALLGQLRAGDDHYIDLRLGLGRSRGWQYLQGDARWTMQASDSFSLSAAAERTPLLTDAAIERRLLGDTYSLAASLRPAAAWYVLPAYYRQSFSDGNHRDGGTLRVLLSPRDIPDTAAAIGAQLSTRIYHSSRPSRGVYFNPAGYRAVQAGVIGVYGISPGWKLRATADVGTQTIDGMHAGIYSWQASLDGRLPHNGRLAFQLGRSSAASDSSGGAGYWNNSLTVSISYPL